MGSLFTLKIKKERYIIYAYFTVFDCSISLDGDQSKIENNRQIMTKT